MCECVCVYVCVCNVRLFDIKFIPHYSWCQLSPSSQPLCYPWYKPTSMSPLLYADYFPASCLSYWSLLIPSLPSVSPIFNLTRARSVPSPPRPSAQVAAGCAPLCHEGRVGSGCWTSIFLVTSSPAQIHTFNSIPASACSWVMRLTSFVRLRPPLRVFRPQSRP